MSDPAWLSYTGAITGVIGTITGISGAIMGYISLRESKKLKAFDLRLELRKTEHDVHEIVRDLTPLLLRASESRIAVTSASWSPNSGAYQQWLDDWKEAMLDVSSLVENLPDPGADYKDLAYTALEAKLVAIHALRSKAVHIREKYRASLAHDDNEREQIRADTREMIKPR
jgi:hypothetical protein